MQEVRPTGQTVFIEGHDVGHALIVEKGCRVREEVVSERSVIEEQQMVKGRYGGAGVAPCPIFSPLVGSPSY
jgi:hypothetical protein